MVNKWQQILYSKRNMHNIKCFSCGKKNLLHPIKLNRKIRSKMKVITLKRKKTTTTTTTSTQETKKKIIIKTGERKESTLKLIVQEYNAYRGKDRVGIKTRAQPQLTAVHNKMLFISMRKIAERVCEKRTLMFCRYLCFWFLRSLFYTSLFLSHLFVPLFFSSFFAKFGTNRWKNTHQKPIRLIQI